MQLLNKHLQHTYCVLGPALTISKHEVITCWVGNYDPLYFTDGETKAQSG